MVHPTAKDNAKVRQGVPNPGKTSRKRRHKADPSDSCTISYNNSTEADEPAFQSESASCIEFETMEASEMSIHKCGETGKVRKTQRDHPSRHSVEGQSLLKSQVEPAANGLGAIKAENDEPEEFLSENKNADVKDNVMPATSNAKKRLKSRLNDMPIPISLKDMEKVEAEEPSSAAAEVADTRSDNYAEGSDSSSVTSSKSTNGCSELYVVPDNHILCWPNNRNAKYRNETSVPKQTWSAVAANMKRCHRDDFKEAGRLRKENSANFSPDQLSSRVALSDDEETKPQTIPNDANASFLTTIDKSDEILSFLSRIDERLTGLSDRMDSIATKVDFLMDAMQSSGQSFSAANIEAPYAKARDRRQLENLEACLEEQDFKQKWLKWLNVNVTRSDCAERRMLSMLDLIMSKELQSQCSWTGASRNGQPKICFMELRNILAGFRRIGTTETEIVTQEKLANFFMKKLKNATKRAAYTGKRMSTPHVFRLRKKDDKETSN